MQLSKSKPLTILVTDASRGSAISIIRSLGRRGWRVIAADSNGHSPGFLSRYTQVKWLYPKPETTPQDYVDSIAEAVQKHGVDLVIPVTDAALLPLSKERKRFEGMCKLAIAEPAMLAMATNKCKTLELAAELGVPAPRTFLVHSAQEALAKAKSLQWPIVLKPQVSRLFQEHADIKVLEVSYAESLEQLAARMAQYHGCPVLLQEYYAGFGQGVELLMDRGRPLAAFQHRRLREVPISGGASSFRESVPLDPIQYDYAVRLLQALQWSGLAMVEFKVGKDGPKLMEINGRVWGSLPLAVHSGMDFPARLVELYLGEPSPSTAAPDTNYKIGVRSRNLALDVVWIATVLAGRRRYPFVKLPKRIEGVKTMLGLFNPRNKFDILSSTDLRPGFAEIAQIARSLSGKMQKLN
jgi:predicted ATP-grasp superfamily ATP-dependent carboligase